MSNGEVCCILGVCCPPAARKTSISQALQKDLQHDPISADLTAEWFDTRFDFAPKGFLQPLIDHIADAAIEHAKANGGTE